MNAITRYVTMGLIVAIVLVGARSAAGSHGAASGPGAGTIIYAQMFGNERTAVYRLDLTPHHWRRLIANADEPEVSRSGRRVAFVRGRNIWIANGDGTHQVRITRGGRDSDPAWGPHDRLIYFSRRLGAAVDTETAAVFRIRARGAAQCN